MNEKFFDLKKEKQDRMINAALKVFALHGYRHACTDDIVKEAAISKGLLFHYFGSKLGVYAFVYDYSVRYCLRRWMRRRRICLLCCSRWNVAKCMPCAVILICSLF